MTSTNFGAYQIVQTLFFRYLHYCVIIGAVVSLLAMPTPLYKGFIYPHDQIERARAFVQEHDGVFTQSVDVGFVPTQVKLGCSPFSELPVSVVGNDMFTAMLNAGMMRDPVLYVKEFSLTASAETVPGYDHYLVMTSIPVPEAITFMASRALTGVERDDGRRSTVKLRWTVSAGHRWFVLLCICTVIVSLCISVCMLIFIVVFSLVARHLPSPAAAS